MKETVDPQIIEQLELISTKFQEAINNNDAAAVAELFAEDGVFVTEGGPFCGRKAIERFFVDLFKEWRLSNHLAKTAPNFHRTIGTAENIAFNGEWSQTLQGQGGQRGNGWKILMLTANVTSAPGGFRLQTLKSEGESAISKSRTC
jgi:ketosteroid isomerase-like protein